MNYSIPQTPADKLILILERLHQALGHHADAQTRIRRGHLIGRFLVLLWGRVRRIGQRFAARAAREAAALTAPPNVIARREAARQSRKPPQPGSSNPDALPRRKAWLLTMIPETAPIMGQLLSFLEDPEAAALLAASPRLCSILNPLCHMLGIPAASIQAANTQAAALQRAKTLAAEALAAEALAATALSTAAQPPSQPPKAPPVAPPIQGQAPEHAPNQAPTITPPPSPTAPPPAFLRTEA